jgi:hypothetical protein
VDVVKRIRQPVCKEQVLHHLVAVPAGSVQACACELELGSKRA